MLRQELEDRKKVANNFLSLKQIEKARDIYFSILFDIETLTEYDDIKIACYNNLSSLFLDHGEIQEVLRLTTKTLEIDSRNLKALYRQSQAYDKLGQYSLAIEFIQKLLEIEPSNKQGKTFLSLLIDKISNSDHDRNKFDSTNIELNQEIILV